MKKLLASFTLLIFAFTAGAQLSENFDAGTFPPVGWTNVHSTGSNTSAVWAGGTSSDIYGDDNGVSTFLYVTPHSGTTMAWFDCYNFTSGNGATLATSAFSLVSGGPKMVTFWMYRDQYYSSSLDSLSVYINTTQNLSGASFLGKIIRPRSSTPVESADGWYQYNFNIPSGFNTASNYLLFNAVSSFGNGIVMDDVAVAAQPSCTTPTAVNLSNYNYAAGTATGGWTAASGSPIGYEWALNTTGVAPASGTAVAATSTSIAGISSGVINYFFVRTSCGAGSFSTWVSSSFAALPCATITAPADGATNVPQTQSFTWTAVTGATSYNFYLGTTAGSLTNIGTIAGTSTTVSNLAANTTYYWYIVPTISGIAAPNACSINSFTIATEGNTPPNNACTGAIVITAGNVAGNAVAGTTVGASQTLPANVCAGFTGNADDDVWFQFTTSAATPAGTLTITPDATGGINDIVAQVYASSSCGTFGTAVTCADATGGSNPEVVDLSVLAPSTHYYMRVYSYQGGTSVQGSFTIIASATNTIPITLDFFTAQRTGNINVLSWRTAQEINSNYFVIERSYDGRNYFSIGQVTAAGNSSTASSYVFTDINPMRGVNYYRLRLVDRDNSNKYSVVRSVRNEGVADIAIYPNPVNDQLKVVINADNPGQGSFAISDISGKTIYTRTVSITRGSNVLPVNTSAFAAGAYIIKVQLNDDVVVRKFNKF